MSNTFELTAQMILFADTKGRGAAKLITPAYNINESINEYRKLKVVAAKDIDVTGPQKIIINAVILPANIGDGDGKAKIDGKVSEVDLAILRDNTKYKTPTPTPAQIKALKKLISEFSTIQKAPAAVARTKEKLESQFSTLKSDTDTLIALTTDQDIKSLTTTGSYVDAFYKKSGSTESGVLIDLRDTVTPTDLDAADAFATFTANYNKTISSTTNGKIDFNLFTAKKTQAENVIKTDKPISVKKAAVKTALKIEDNSFPDKVIPALTKVEFEWDFDTKDIKFGVEANPGAGGINGKPSLFYLNQGTLLFIHKADNPT